MLFNSYIFLFLFLPAALLGYYVLRLKCSREASFVILVLASLLYYGYWKVSYLPILLISIVANYALGILLVKQINQGTKKLLLIVGIALNLAALGYYKYANFFLSNFEWLVGESYSTLNIVLPLAISFFTFQQIAYLVDASKGEAKEYSFIHYCLFISFFPQLIAGPIVHHKEMLPQFMDKARAYFDVEMFWQGVQLFCIGLAKKVLIADNVALFATPVFFAADSGYEISTVAAWIGILAYAFQLYFDFSAYSDMAIGIGKMFGIDLPLNFNSPYKAVSISDFWRRWHMTLSRFLRDYLYIALGGNRVGAFRRHINLFLTMLLGGLWHGASWNFVLWGGLHGSYLIINHFWTGFCKQNNINTSKQGYILLAKLLTFFCVIEAWVLFRAETFEGAMALYSASFSFDNIQLSAILTSQVEYVSEPIKAILMIIFCAVTAFICPNSQEIVAGKYLALSEKGFYKRAYYFTLPLLLSGLLVAAISSMNKVSEFLYFQF